MRSRRRLAVSLLAFFPVIAVAVGCSHTDLEDGTQALSVDIIPNPAGTGRYERASFQIQTIQALPVDPNTPAIYGNDSLLFTFEQNVRVELDLLTSPIHYSAIALGNGLYRITKFSITTPSIVDEDDLPPNPPTCIEGIAVLQAGSAPGLPGNFEFIDPPGMTFTISPGQTLLPIKINVPGFIAGFENAFTCQLGCGPGGAPCLTAFDEAAFRSAVLANVSFQ